MEFVKTADGSKTLYHETIGEHYHSKHGAHQESMHVFRDTGLKFWLDRHATKEVSILEIGFGTGLNFLVTADFCHMESISLNYVGIEAFPLDLSVLKDSGYDAYVDPSIWNSFTAHYMPALTDKVALTEQLRLQIAYQKVMEFRTQELFDIIYFDAFAEIHQPEMWTVETLNHVCQFLRPGGVFVTYAITGNLKRAMKSLGFKIEKAPGAPGKREMLRAILS